MSTAVESNEQTPSAEETAKATLKQAQETLKSRKGDVIRAKKAVTAAEKNAKSAEGDAKPEAEKKVDEAKDALANANQAVEQASAEVETAKTAVTEAREVDKKARAEQRAAKPKKASLTLSQRRALLKLGDGPQTPHTDFNQLPLQHLVRVGLAQVEPVEIEIEKTRKVEKEEPLPTPEGGFKEGEPTTKTVKVDESYAEKATRNQYTLTDVGIERVKEINPKWKTWRAPSQATATTSETPADVNGDAQASA